MIGTIVLDWYTVPGTGVTYEVQQKVVRPGILPDSWKKLPFSKYLISITDSKATIGGMDRDSIYYHRVRALRDGKYSAWSYEHETQVLLPFIGHQADHTVKYVLGEMPRPMPDLTSSGNTSAIIAAPISPSDSIP